MEELGFLSVREKLSEAKRKDFLDGLGVDLGLADLGCEREEEALVCMALN